MGVNQMNPMMGLGGPMNFPPPGAWAPWQQQGQQSPMMPHPSQFGQNSDFLAAHQQAMLIAKQTYQMAVAQQALAAAGDEWERSSNAGGFGGGSQFGGSQMGGSQIGGSQMGGSQLGINPTFGGSPGFGGNMNMGMFGMGGGMSGYGGMGMPGGWPNASLMPPPGPRSAYGGFGGAQSEYGGSSPGSVAGWGSRSVYGEAFGPSPGDRSSKAFSGSPAQLQQYQQQQQSYFASPTKSTPDRERRKEPSGYSNRADSGKSTTAQHPRPGPRPRTLTAPSSSEPPAQHSSKTKKSPPLLPPSSWSRFQD